MAPPTVKKPLLFLFFMLVVTPILYVFFTATLTILLVLITTPQVDLRQFSAFILDDAFNRIAFLLSWLYFFFLFVAFWFWMGFYAAIKALCVLHHASYDNCTNSTILCGIVGNSTLGPVRKFVDHDLLSHNLLWSFENSTAFEFLYSKALQFGPLKEPFNGSFTSLNACGNALSGIQNMFKALVVYSMEVSLRWTCGSCLPLRRLVVWQSASHSLGILGVVETHLQRGLLLAVKILLVLKGNCLSMSANILCLFQTVLNLFVNGFARLVNIFSGLVQSALSVSSCVYSAYSVYEVVRASSIVQIRDLIDLLSTVLVSSLDSLAAFVVSQQIAFVVWSARLKDKLLDVCILIGFTLAITVVFFLNLIIDFVVVPLVDFLYVIFLDVKGLFIWMMFLLNPPVAKSISFVFSTFGLLDAVLRNTQHLLLAQPVLFSLLLLGVLMYTIWDEKQIKRLLFILRHGFLPSLRKILLMRWVIYLRRSRTLRLKSKTRRYMYRWTKSRSRYLTMDWTAGFDVTGWTQEIKGSKALGIEPDWYWATCVEVSSSGRLLVTSEADWRPKFPLVDDSWYKGFEEYREMFDACGDTIPLLVPLPASRRPLHKQRPNPDLARFRFYNDSSDEFDSDDDEPGPEAAPIVPFSLKDVKVVLPRGSSLYQQDLYRRLLAARYRARGETAPTIQEELYSDSSSDEEILAIEEDTVVDEIVGRSPHVPPLEVKEPADLVSQQPNVYDSEPFIDELPLSIINQAEEKLDPFAAFSQVDLSFQDYLGVTGIDSQSTAEVSDPVHDPEPLWIPLRDDLPDIVTVRSAFRDGDSEDGDLYAPSEFSALAQLPAAGVQTTTISLPTVAMFGTTDSALVISLADVEPELPVSAVSTEHDRTKSTSTVVMLCEPEPVMEGESIFEMPLSSASTSATEPESHVNVQMQVTTLTAQTEPTLGSSRIFVEPEPLAPLVSAPPQIESVSTDDTIALFPMVMNATIASQEVKKPERLAVGLVGPVGPVVQARETKSQPVKYYAAGSSVQSPLSMVQYPTKIGMVEDYIDDNSETMQMEEEQMVPISNTIIRPNLDITGPSSGFPTTTPPSLDITGPSSGFPTTIPPNLESTGPSSVFPTTIPFVSRPIRMAMSRAQQAPPPAPITLQPSPRLPMLRKKRPVNPFLPRVARKPPISGSSSPMRSTTSCVERAAMASCTSAMEGIESTPMRLAPLPVKTINPHPHASDSHASSFAVSLSNPPIPSQRPFAGTLPSAIAPNNSGLGEYLMDIDEVEKEMDAIISMLRAMELQEMKTRQAFAKQDRDRQLEVVIRREPRVKMMKLSESVELDMPDAEPSRIHQRMERDRDARTGPHVPAPPQLFAAKAAGQKKRAELERKLAEFLAQEKLQEKKARQLKEEQQAKAARRKAVLEAKLKAEAQFAEEKRLANKTAKRCAEERAQTGCPKDEKVIAAHSTKEVKSEECARVSASIQGRSHKNLSSGKRFMIKPPDDRKYPGLSLKDSFSDVNLKRTKKEDLNLYPSKKVFQKHDKEDDQEDDKRDEEKPEGDRMA